MNTPLLPRRPAHPTHFGDVLLRPLLLALLALCVAVPRPAAGQTDSPGVERADADSARADSISTEFESSFRVYPSPLWSKTAGFAAGVGYDVRNALVPHDRLLVTAKPGQHLGRYTASYFAGDSDRHAVYGLASAYYETTGRQWYYGVGPRSSADHQIAVEKTMVDLDVRAGLQPFERRLFVQPVFGYHRHDVLGYENWQDDAYTLLDGRSRGVLRTALGETAGSSSLQHGISYGIQAGVDLRHGPVYRRTGLELQVSGRRFAYREPETLEFDRYEIRAYAFLSVDRNTLAFRAITKLTNPHPGADVPFYMLPVLDGRLLPGYAWERFFGRDLFAVTLEYGVPLFQLFDYASLDAVASVGAGSVYDDIGEQFEPSITFDERVYEAETVPLRPSAAIGFELDSFSSDTWDARVLLGWGAEGVRLIQFGFVHDLQDVQLNDR